MKNVFINGTDRTPEVDFRFEEGLLKLSGRSITENPNNFYTSLENYLNEYAFNAQQNTVFMVKLEYFNTSTSKCLADLFKQLEKLHNNGKQVIVEWYYEQDDEEIKDSGYDYKDIVNVPFEIKLLKS
ncbi:MAG: DUF1987 domain-containing protein [Cyclobacteriaceae bacterium]|nr:DUF1987 domain-containing protein [Cyclobacteriaceae bacterium]